MSNSVKKFFPFLSRASPRILRHACINRPTSFRRSLTFQSTTRTKPTTASNGASPRPSEQKRLAAELAQDKKKFNQLATAAAVCMGIIFGIVYYIELPNPRKTIKANSPKRDTKEYLGKSVVVTAGGLKIGAQDKSGTDVLLVPTGASAIPHFPKTIRLPQSQGLSGDDLEYTLLGLGVRTVSFFKVQVYVIGLYVETSSLDALQSHLIKRINPMASALILGEKDKLRSDLLGEESQQVWDELLKDMHKNIKTAFRIVPTRNTDFRHMLDGWIRGITARTQVASASGDKQFSDESFATSVKSLMNLFSGRGISPKGSVLLLQRDGAGSLHVLYEDPASTTSTSHKGLESFGQVKDERIARLLWLGYLGGKSVSSEQARQSIVDGVIELVQRPMGTVADKIEG